MGWRGFGFVHRSRTIFCRAVPNLSITIRNFFVAVCTSAASLTDPSGDTYRARCPGVCLPHDDTLEGVQVNSRTHVPQKLTGFISLYTNPVSILTVPIQTVH
jgi:hypothetical protein